MVADFLLQHGGLSNGYETKAVGRLRHNHTGCLSIYTPICRDLTYKKVAELGRELEWKIVSYLKEHQIYETIVLEHAYAEHGCGDNIVSYTTSVPVKFYAAEKRRQARQDK